MPKIVQINTVKDEGSRPKIIALADDGTMWVATVNEVTGEALRNGWVQIEPVQFNHPQGTK